MESTALSYLQTLFDYSQVIQSMIPKTNGFDFSSFSVLFTGISLYGGKLQCFLVIIAVIFCGTIVFLEKKTYLAFLMGLICISFLIFSTMNYFSFHPNYPRYSVYLTPLFSLCIAYGIFRVERHTNRYFVIIFFLVFSLFSIPKSLEIISHTFKIEPITQWLEHQKISKERIITALDIFEDGDITIATSVPGEFLDYPWGYFKINWEMIRTLYEEEGLRYIITSGIGTKSTVGYKETMLEGIKPLQTWFHPLHFRNPENKRSQYRLPDEKVQDFSIYDLEEIFIGLKHGSAYVQGP